MFHGNITPGSNNFLKQPTVLNHVLAPADFTKKLQKNSF